MPADPNRVREVFLAAVELTPEERPGYLAEACRGVAELRAEVDRLLAAIAQRERTLEPGSSERDFTNASSPTEPRSVDLPGRTFDMDTFNPDVPILPAMGTVDHLSDGGTEVLAHADSHAATTAASGATAPRAARGPIGGGIGTVIDGRYTLVELIGEGGMGSVYLAEQTRPVKRQVALKLIKTGQDSKSVLARFDAERQALALMDHPNIARIYDGGVTPEGRPFFVMELVRGAPLTEYCDEHRLSVRGRLELFVVVCQAVQYAHQKGIIHRDLKPSNVLVTEFDGRPTPKVIDFGVAKATEQRLTDVSLAETGAIVGTPSYMSPEQADPSSLDIDTRTDIYALGAMLYELLTGSPPLDAGQFRRGAVLEMLRMVREVEPPRPSTKLSTSEVLPNVAAKRSIEPARLAKLLRGELDWVVMKALEKDRTRRYETASGFARDILRYLADEVVEARPPGTGYRLKKFVRRNPLQLALAASIALLFSGGGAVALWQNQQATARRVTDLRRRFEDEQRTAAENARRARNAEAVAALLGQAEQALKANDAPKAAVALEAARKRSDEGGAEQVSELLDRLNADLTILVDLDAVDQFRWTPADNKFPDPAVVAARTREALRRGGVDADALSVGAAARVSRSAVRERIVSALDRVLSIEQSAGVRAVLRGVDPNPYRDAVRDAFLARDGAKFAELTGQPAALEQSPGFVANLGESNGISVERSRQLLRAAVDRRPGDPGLLMALGNTFPMNQKDGADERLRWYQAAVAAAPGNSAAHTHLGSALKDKGLEDEAMACYEKAIELYPRNASAHSTMGILLVKQGRVDEAAACFKKAIDFDPKNAIAHNNMGHMFWAKGQVDEAIAHFKKAIELHPKFGMAHSNLGAAFSAKGQMDEAIACYKKAIEIDPKFALAHSNLGTALSRKGRVDEAIACYKKAIELDAQGLSAYTGLGGILCDTKKDYDGALACFKKAIELEPNDAESHFCLGNALGHKGQFALAAACYRKAIALAPKHAGARSGLGLVLKAQGQLDEAIACYKQAIEVDPKNVNAHFNLGVALADKGRVDEAITMYRKAIELDPKNVNAHFNLGVALADKGRVDEAITMYGKATELDPQYAAAQINLGSLLAQKGRMDEAIPCFKKAVELEPKFALPHKYLGMALAAKGQVDEAIICLQTAIKLEPGFADASCKLGELLGRQGRFAESLAAFKRGHELGSKQPGWRYPSAQWVRRAEAEAAMEAKLPAFLRGESQPRDSAERLGLASVCLVKKLPHAATALYAAAFADDPKLANDLRSAHRYNAACSAALAAGGQGDDAARLDDAERTRLRKQALEWLRADMAAYAKQIESDKPADRAAAKRSLRHSQQDGDLKSIRDAAAVLKLPADEQKAWTQLWADVAELLQRADVRKALNDSSRF